MTVDANATQEIRQNPQLTTTAIDGLNSQHQADIHVTISYLDNGQPRTILDQTSQTLITSRRDFPWSIKGFTQQENYDLVVAMITPTDPSVEALIIAAGKIDPAWQAGYHSENDADGSVWQRLADIWQIETDNALSYDSTTISFASGSSQRIRLPGEVLDQNGGNCIELALLYASVAEALSMQPALVIVPGHAYVAVRLDDTNNNYYFIETTMIGQATFKEAVTYANTEWADAQPHVDAGDFGLRLGGRCVRTGGRHHPDPLAIGVSPPVSGAAGRPGRVPPGLDGAGRGRPEGGREARTISGPRSA